MPRSIPFILLASLAAVPACSDYRETERGSAEYSSSSDWRASAASDATNRFKTADHTLDRFFKDAYAYAIFPKITKGGIALGAAHGADGVVYEKGGLIGYAEVTQVTLGAQLGGQDYAEIIFFQNKSVLDDFKSNNMEFAANASAVAATSGAAASSDYSHGVAVFTMPLGGLMFEASIGGQKFQYYPK